MVSSLTAADAVELERGRLLLPRLLMAHHQQRHVRRVLRRCSSPRRLPRTTPSRRPRIRCLPAPPIPAPITSPTSCSRGRHARELLRWAATSLGHPICDISREWTAATSSSDNSRGNVGRSVHCHVADYVLQRIHFHKHHIGSSTGQISLRLDGCAITVWW